MKRRPSTLIYLFVYGSIYPLLIFFIIVTAVGVNFLFSFNLLPRLSDFADNPTPTRITRRLAKLPTAPPSATPAPNVSNPTTQPNTALPDTQQQNSPTTQAPTPAATASTGEAPQRTTQQQQTNATVPPTNTTTGTEPVQTSGQANPPPAPTPSPTIDLDFSVFSGDNTASEPAPTRTPRPTATPTPENVIKGLVNGLMSAINEASPTPKRQTTPLPTLTPTPTSTSTPLPTATPTNTSTPTQTPTPTVTPTFTNTPPPTNTPTATAVPTNTPVPPPTNTPPPTATPLPEYDFMLNEFFNSPTSNHFLVMYVAVVDGNDIPIGDMKVVGTRLDHNLTYESPLTTWHYEGYNAPGEVVKSGNTKFEPPGGIEDISWVLHLEDAHGNRMSADVPFDTSQNNPQWYFVKFRRKY